MYKNALIILLKLLARFTFIVRDTTDARKKSEFFTLHANGSCKIDNGCYAASSSWIVLFVQFFTWNSNWSRFSNLFAINMILGILVCEFIKLRKIFSQKYINHQIYQQDILINILTKMWRNLFKENNKNMMI